MVAAGWHTFPNPKANVAIIGTAAVVIAVTFGVIRDQTLVGDTQFLRSMIPHHSIAIKTCENAHYGDPDIAGLCDDIVKAQREEGAEMRQILARLD